MADILYGVTMQEHGVSKIVSVKFHKEAEQPAAVENPEPGRRKARCPRPSIWLSATAAR